jgi:DNA-binding PucR family transcriptional regulator
MIASVAAASVAQAQDRPMYELPAIEVNVLQTGLHQQAIDLYEFPERWGEAADLHRKAAENLTKNDAGQFFGYSRAALLYFYAGDLAAARRSMEDAAQVAEATGDILTAANAFVDAAFIAVAEDYDGKRREFVGEARELVDSPVLRDEDRAEILARIEGAPAGVASVRVALGNRFGSLETLALAP